MVPEYVAYISAQRVEEFAARNALAGAVVRPEADTRTGDSRFTGTRAGLSTVLRRLADRLDPAPRPANPVAAYRR